MLAKARPGKVLRRWVISFVCFVAATTTVVSSVLSSWYSRESIRAFGELAVKELRQTANTMELLDESIKNTGFLLVQDTDVTVLMSSATPLEPVALGVRRTIMHAMLANPMIASVYLVNKRANVIIGSPSPESAVARDYHRRIAALVQGRRENAIIRIDSRETALVPGASATAGILSYVFFTARMSGPDDSFLIINLRADDIFGKIIDASPIKGHVILVVNRGGETVFPRTSDAPYAPEELARALAMVASDPGGTGSILGARIGAQLNLVAFASSEVLGYRFVSITPYDVVLRTAVQLRNRTIVLGVLIFAAGLLLSVLIARRFYEPLGMLVQKYAGGNALRRPGDEYKMLGDVLESSSTRATSLDDFVGRNLPLIRQDYLQRILDGRIGLEAAGTRERLRELGVEFHHGVFRAVLLALDQPKDAQAGRVAAGLEALRRKAGAIGERMTDGACCREVIDGADGLSVILLLNYPEDTKENAERARGMCMALGEAMRREHGFSVTAAIGRECAGGIKDSYLGARELMGYRIKYGEGAILDDQLVAADIRGHDLFPRDEEKDLLESIRTLSQERMRESVRRLFEQFRGFSSNDISRALLHVLYGGLQAISDMTRVERVSVDVDLFSVYGRMNRCASLSEMETELAGFYGGMIEKLERSIRQSGTSHTHVMKKVVDYLEANYHDPRISLDLVAAQVTMNPAYLGRIIKDYLGSHFTDYLNRLRLEKAKELLVGSTLTISEVSQKTGFSSPSYFIACFKKQLGMTPVAYRNIKAIQA